MSVLKIPTAEVFAPLYEPARYKSAKGGRGSGKSHDRAGALVEDAYCTPGFRAVCIREVQKTLAESAKKLIEDKIEEYGLGAHFDCQRDRILTPGGGSILFQGMQDHNAESIKSLEGVDCAWVEEAQTLSRRSLSLLRPTIRKPGSEIWFTRNPRRKTDAVDEFLATKPPGLIEVTANWRDNPWFPEVLEQERQHDLRVYPEQYGHVWEGEYAQAFEGAYFAHLLAMAQREGRIGHVAADPLMTIRSYHDIGGAGAKADAYAIWIVQFANREIRVLDYYESVGQTLEYHVAWMREQGYENASVNLPHDGVNTNNITGKRYADHWREAGFDVNTIPNQGAGAAMQRIEAVRRLFPRMWFNADTTEPGREALGWYHEKRNEDRRIGLGPEHDWSSHGADAFGLMAVHYHEPQTTQPRRRLVRERNAVTGY